MDTRPGQRFFWTKTWGAPAAPHLDALTFFLESRRDDALRQLRPGDVVVYLTTTDSYADPRFRGAVAGAVEIEGKPIMVEEIGLPNRAPPDHFNDDGEYRWRYAITIRRSWRAVEVLRNDDIIPDHADRNMQGALSIHPVPPSGAGRIERLRMVEITAEGETEAMRLSEFRPRPPRQVAGPRAGGEVDPGCDLYVAMILSHGLTFKIGSGHSKDRLADLNHYRRPSMKEETWQFALGLVHTFETPDAARDAEDHLLAAGKARGFGSPDHSEFLICDVRDVKLLFDAVVEHGRESDARGLSEAAESTDAPV